MMGKGKTHAWLPSRAKCLDLMIGSGAVELDATSLNKSHSLTYLISYFSICRSVDVHMSVFNVCNPLRKSARTY